MGLWRLRSTRLGRTGLLLLSALVFGGIGAVVTLLLPPSYEAETAMLVSRTAGGSTPGYEDLLAGQLLAQTYAELALTRPILTAVAGDLKLNETPEQVADDISAQASGLNPIVRITVRRSDPDLAAGIANEVAQQLIAWRSAEDTDTSGRLAELNASLTTVDSEIERAQAEIEALAGQGGSTAASSLRAELDRLTTLLANQGSLLELMNETNEITLSVIEPASTPIGPARPGLLLNATAAALLGLLLMAGVLALTTEGR